MTSLRRSVFRLQLLQLAAISLPILIQPWLARYLGPFQYGRLIFVSALTAYFVLLCDFGFAWSASRAIAVNRSDANRCSEVVCTTLFAKGALFVVGLLVLLALIVLVDEFRKEAWLVLAAYGGVLGTVLSPTWYFLGTERPHIGLGVDILGRLIGLPLVFVGVNDPGDLMFAIASLSAGQLIGGASGLALLFREPELRWKTPSFKGVADVLRKGVPLFLSTSAISLYTATSGLVLGFLSTREEVAYFGAAQKIIGAGSMVLNPFHQVFYPRISHQLHHNPRAARGLLSTALLMQGVVGLAASAGMFLFADELSILLFGAPFERAAISLRWMAPVPFLLAVASVFANFIIMALGRDGVHLTMTLAAAVINFGVLIWLAPSLGSAGAGAALLIAECFVLLYALVVGATLLRRVLRDAAP